MKSLILSLTLCSFFSTLAFAQQKPVVANINNTMRTETYRSFKYQTDSIRFSIAGQNDTVLVENFYPSGQLKYQNWRNDSVYSFDKLGRLQYKDYFPKGQKHQKKTQIRYYPNGKIKNIETSQQDDETFTAYDETDALEIHTEKKQIAPSVFYTISYDGQNRKRLSRKEIQGYVYRNDSTTLNMDTVFYETGRIKKTQTLAGHYMLSFAEYNQNGQQIAPLFPDSLRLFPFKDNFNCYYGLKNRRDDTVFSPRFDNVLPLHHDDLFTVQIGDRVQLWRQDGKQLSTNSMNGLRNLKDEWGLYNRNIINFPRQIIDFNKNYWESGSTPDTRNDAFFNFKTETGNGIINAEGKVVIPPQYPPFYDADDFGKYFAFSKVPRNYGAYHSKVIDLSGKILFNDRYPYVSISPIRGYFNTANQENIGDETNFARGGLVDSMGTEILPNLYKSISSFGVSESNLVWVDLGKEQLNSENKKEFVTERSGIFNIKTRTWHTPLNILKDGQYDTDDNNFIALQLDTRKMGLLSNKGTIVLPFVYDSVYLSDQKDYYILIKNGNYQFYSIEKKTFSSNYTFLEHLDIDHYNSIGKPKPTYFAAKRGDKWGIIDDKETVIVPFQYEYATTNGKNGDDKGLILVKNNEITMHEFECFPMPLPKPFIVREDELFQSFKLVDKPKRFCLVEMKTGRVVLPPQYETLNNDDSYRNNGSYLIVEAEKGKRKILFKNETELIDYPFEPFPEHISSSKNLILFEKEKVMQIANLRQGKILHTITEGGIAIGSDSLDNYFISELPPIQDEDIKHTYSLIDTLSKHDRNWIWLDVNGKRLNTDTFRYPLAFEKGLGVGMVGDKYGIWREDGSVFAPPQYENIKYYTKEKRFCLFQNIGLKNWLVMMDLNGKALVNTGFYDGISAFYEDYALVSLNGKIGLIDTNGREIIAPIVMENNAVNFLDSLDYQARRDKLEGKPKTKKGRYYTYERLPVITGSYRDKKAIDFDTLPYLAQNRNLVFNILLKPQLLYILKTANNKNIYRAEKRVQSHHTSYGRGCGTGIAWNGSIEFPSFSDNAISFTTTKIGYSEGDVDYINYRRRNNAWQQVQINDVLNLTMDNPLKINDLLGKKIQTLKDKDIDCGMAESFLERSQNTALLTERGIDFYFSGKGHYIPHIPVELTWQELKPFLK
jgi:hypothetical protein